MSGLTIHVSCSQTTSDLTIRESVFTRYNIGEGRTIKRLQDAINERLNHLAFCRQIEIFEAICKGYVKRWLNGNLKTIQSFDGMIGHLNDRKILEEITEQKGYNPSKDGRLWRVAPGRELRYYEQHSIRKFAPEAVEQCRALVRESRKRHQGEL